MPDVKLITFDLDNTLWDVDSVIRKAENSLRAWLLEEVPEVVARYSPEAMIELRTALLRENPRWRHNLSLLREELLYQAIRRSGYGEREARRTRGRRFRRIPGRSPRRGVLCRRPGDPGRTRQGLHPWGAHQRQRGHRQAEPGPLLFVRLLGSRVGVGKPAPDIFHAALRHANASAAETIHVGDHLVDDVHGANEVGIHTIWVNLKQQSLPEDASLPRTR